jgi:hypothetical protein
MARHLAKEAKSRFLDKLSNAMLIVVSSGAVIVLGVHIYLRKEGLVPGAGYSRTNPNEINFSSLLIRLAAIVLQLSFYLLIAHFAFSSTIF